MGKGGEVTAAGGGLVAGGGWTLVAPTVELAPAASAGAGGAVTWTGLAAGDAGGGDWTLEPKVESFPAANAWAAQQHSSRQTTIVLTACCCETVLLLLLRAAFNPRTPIAIAEMQSLNPRGPEGVWLGWVQCRPALLSSLLVRNMQV